MNGNFYVASWLLVYKIMSFKLMLNSIKSFIPANFNHK